MFGRKRHRLRKYISLIMLVGVLCSIFVIAVCAEMPVQTKAGHGIHGVDLSVLEGRRFGVLTGSPQDEMVRSVLINPNLVYYNSNTDMAMALQQGKIDAYLNNTIQCALMESAYPEFSYLNQTVRQFENGTIFARTEKGNTLLTEFNRYIADITADGTLQSMKDYWFSARDWTATAIPAAGKNGTVQMGTSSTLKPFSFMIDGQNSGFDIEIVAEFCRRNGYGLQIHDTDFAGVLSGVAAGKFDLAAGQIAYTQQRAENVNFSTLYVSQDFVFVVRKADFASANTSAEGTLKFNTLEELNKAKTVGVVTGTILDAVAAEYLPDTEIKYYANLIDSVIALQSGKVDTVLYDEPNLRYLASTKQYSDLGLLPEYFFEEDYHFVLSKTEQGAALRQELNRWLAEKKQSGYLEELRSRWVGDGEPYNIDFSSVKTGQNGTLRICVSIESRPSTFMLNNQPTGYPIELIYQFCKDNGYGLETEILEMDAKIPSLLSGKSDICIGFYSYTEERAKSVLYSDSVYSGGLAAMVRKTTTIVADSPSFVESISSSFKRTFLNENRWVMILRGLLVTLCITAGGFVLANIVGAGVCAMAMSKWKILHIIADMYSRIMQGTPLVVILMILYYIVFGKSSIPAELVAIIGFGITSGAYLAQLFQGAIQGVPIGQWEASLALGFTKFQTFKGVILPKAVRTMLPGYFSNLISLMKGTAIVGYIAVVDLTKVGDIIRSSTYEAFFPLLAIAAIYFVIACILLSVLKGFQKKLAPKRMQKEAETK